MTIAEQRALHDTFGPGATEEFEGGLRLIVVPSIKLPDGCAPSASMAIFVASPYLSYESRLYFEAAVTMKNGFQPQTTTALLLGRTMYAASIQGIPSSLEPHQGIAAHVARYGAAQWS